MTIEWQKRNELGANPDNEETRIVAESGWYWKYGNFGLVIEEDYYNWTDDPEWDSKPSYVPHLWCDFKPQYWQNRYNVYERVEHPKWWDEYLGWYEDIELGFDTFERAEAEAQKMLDWFESDKRKKAI